MKDCPLPTGFQNLLKKVCQKLQKANKEKNKKESQRFTWRFYFLLPFILLLILGVLFSLENPLRENFKKEILFDAPFTVKVYPYPSLDKTFLQTEMENSLSAKAAIVIDNDTKVVVFSKNGNVKFPMASTTKIMTAITALNYFKLDDVLTVKGSGVDGIVAGFRKGQKIYFKDLLYAMLLPSANDAALAISENYPGGKSGFVDKMNGNIIPFKLNNTHFSDPIGLDQENKTTPYDLAKLASIALKNKIFSSIVSTKNHVIKDVGGNNTYNLYNLNKLLGKDGVNGVKTGFTDEAQGVLVTSQARNGHNLIVVVMSSKDRFADTEKLLSMLDENLKFLIF